MQGPGMSMAGRGGPCHPPRSVYLRAMEILVELEQEADGRWLAEARDLPGAMAYAAGPEEAKRAVSALALRVVADRIEHGEEVPDPITISFVTR